MIRRRTHLAALMLVPAGLAAAPADARTEIHPYIEAQQVFSGDLSGHDQDFVTYSGIAAGVDVTLDGKNVHGQLDYRYDHYFSWKKQYRDTDIHNGLASISYNPMEGLTLGAYGIATRARGSLGAATPGFLFGDLSNTVQVYAIDAGPHYMGHFGDLNVSANYDFGWTKTDNGFSDIDLGPGQPVLQNDFSTISHTASASVGMRPGGAGLPIGWAVSGGYVQDNVNFLSARYISKFARADVTLPVTPTLAFTGGAGYQTNRASQSAILTDATGNAVLDSRRHLQADHSKSRLLSYDQDGLIWDVGVIWRPSARTFLEVHGGRRYGGTVVFGHGEWQISPTSSVQVVAYDDVQSFGRQLTNGLSSLPSSFEQASTPFASPAVGCTFGSNGGNGVCLPALASVNSNFYRSRGAYANWSGSQGLWTYGVGVSYDWRRYLAPGFGPQVFSFEGRHDESVTGDAMLTRRLSATSSLTGTLLATWYDTDAFSSPSFWTYGGALSYAKQFSRHLSGTATISVSSGSGEGTFGDDVIGTGLLSLRYTM